MQTLNGLDPHKLYGTNAFAFNSFHSGRVVQFAYGDGSVRSVPETTEAIVLNALSDRADGAAVNLP
jgi:prepilin-type processing-associated H-X9-DG protein